MRDLSAAPGLHAAPDLCRARGAGRTGREIGWALYTAATPLAARIGLADTGADVDADDAMAAALAKYRPQARIDVLPAATECGRYDLICLAQLPEAPLGDVPDMLAPWRAALAPEGHLILRPGSCCDLADLRDRLDRAGWCVAGERAMAGGARGPVSALLVLTPVLREALPARPPRARRCAALRGAPPDPARVTRP